jgi:hypothetical protein
MTTVFCDMFIARRAAADAHLWLALLHEVHLRAPKELQVAHTQPEHCILLPVGAHLQNKPAHTVGAGGGTWSDMMFYRQHVGIFECGSMRILRWWTEHSILLPVYANLPTTATAAHATNTWGDVSTCRSTCNTHERALSQRGGGVTVRCETEILLPVNAQMQHISNGTQSSGLNDTR